MPDTHDNSTTPDYEQQDVVRISGGNGSGAVSDPGYESDIPVPILRPEDFEPEQLINIYRTMVLSRRLDQKMLTLLKQGKGFFHIGSSGHEAAQAAVALYARPGYDWFCTYYRDLCTALSLGMTSQEILLAHLAKKDDPSSGGRQMAEHFSSREKHIMTTSSSVGAQFLPALGFGMSVLRSDEDAFVYCSCGDGATSQGAFHEAMNWAARLQAPVLFFVQDNKYAISVPSHDQTAGGTAFKLARGYEGMARVRVDGTDFFKTASVAQAAIQHIRDGKGPFCLVADVVRLLPHSSSDDHAKYRTEEELERDRQVDPIARMEMHLVESGILADEDIAGIQADVASQVDEDTRWAEAQPDPDPDSATRHVFFEGPLDLEFESEDPDWTGDPIVMVDAINHALTEEMERDERVIVYGEDVAGGKGGSC